MNKISSTLAALGVGAICAVILLWLWSRDRADAQHFQAAQMAPVTPTVPPAVASPAPSLDGVTRSLLATLQGLLTRTDARAKEAVLSFKDDAAYHRFLDRAKKSGLAVLGQLDALRTARVRYDAFSALQADLMQNTGDYESVSANYLMTIPGPPAKEDRADVSAVPFGNRALQFVGADPAIAARDAWGRGVTIAVLDTGVSPDVTFGDNRVRVLDVGFGTVAGKGSEDGHGTAVAALAAGASADAPGVAPAASLLSIRVTDATGASDLFTVSQGILAATDAGAKIINISLGGYATSPALDAAITYAQDHGAVIVAAAGNDQAAQLAWPAADPRVISVGAVDAAEQQVSFSNSGPQLQMTAPGYGVQTAWLNGQRVDVDGTSISAPIVAGAIAALLSQNPSLTPAAAWQVLQQTASDAGPPGDDPDFGHGILNLGWAMNRNDLTRIDTAVSSHYYDATNHEMDFVIQNRSAIAVTGLTLNLSKSVSTSTTGDSTTAYNIPTLAAGATSIVRVPVDPSTLATGSIKFATQLVNPPGVTDAVPANNRKTSVLTSPTAAPTK